VKDGGENLVLEGWKMTVSRSPANRPHSSRWKYGSSTRRGLIMHRLLYVLLVDKPRFSIVKLEADVVAENIISHAQTMMTLKMVIVTKIATCDG